MRLIKLRCDDQTSVPCRRFTFEARIAAGEMYEDPLILTGTGRVGRICEDLD